jgi:hypothetical protein
LQTDRFLVQLTKVDNVPSGPLSPDDIRKLWEDAQKVTKIVSYKLKVDMQPEVFDALENRASFVAGGSNYSPEAPQEKIVSDSALPFNADA